jgi:hypothetical protein
MISIFVKNNFRNGGANLPVCLDSPQGIATISEIIFDSRSKRQNLKLGIWSFSGAWILVLGGLPL